MTSGPARLRVPSSLAISSHSSTATRTGSSRRCRSSCGDDRRRARVASGALGSLRTRAKFGSRVWRLNRSAQHCARASDLPTGTVTFLFTDVEGSTRLLDELGTEQYADALAEHRRAIREACRAEGGVEVDTQGDAFFFAFPTAPGRARSGGGDDRKHLPPVPSGFASACTRGRPSSPTRATSAVTSIAPRGSPRSATAGRCSSPPPPPSSSSSSSATSASTVSRTCRHPSASFSWETASSQRSARFTARIFQSRRHPSSGASRNSRKSSSSFRRRTRAY